VPLRGAKLKVSGAKVTVGGAKAVFCKKIVLWYKM